MDNGGLKYDLFGFYPDDLGTTWNNATADDPDDDRVVLSKGTFLNYEGESFINLPYFADSEFFQKVMLASVLLHEDVHRWQSFNKETEAYTTELRWLDGLMMDNAIPSDASLSFGQSYSLFRYIDYSTGVAETVLDKNMDQYKWEKSVNSNSDNDGWLFTFSWKEY